MRHCLVPIACSAPRCRGPTDQSIRASRVSLSTSSAQKSSFSVAVGIVAFESVVCLPSFACQAGNFGHTPGDRGLTELPMDKRATSAEVNTKR